jgi:hypothetical protein
MTTSFDFIVNKTNLVETKLETVELPAIKDGEVLLEIDRFAITSNNVTYGVAGDMLGYWNFFPCKEGWGKIPVWGIACVTSSACKGIEEGSLYYGYFPMSKHLIVSPFKLNDHGFSDSTECRQSLSPVYNQYSLVTEKNGFSPSEYNHQIIYRPLFMTSFILDDYMLDNDYFDAEQVILSSASSKTAFGTAFQLAGSGKKVIGLTSEGNMEFVKNLGIYDEVVKYDDVQSLDNNLKTTYIDMSGNRTVLGSVHNHFGDNLVNSCGVGITHWNARDGEDPQSLPGAKPTMFFAPTQIQKRSKEWGPEALQAKLASAWVKFVSFVDDHVQFVESSAPDAIGDVYDTMIEGPSPNKAYVLLSTSRMEK